MMLIVRWRGGEGRSRNRIVGRSSVRGWSEMGRMSSCPTQCSMLRWVKCNCKEISPGGWCLLRIAEHQQPVRRDDL